jgi:hypothetical protein
MDFSLQSSSVIVDGTLKALLFFISMRELHFFNSDIFTMNSCTEDINPVMFSSGSVTGSGYVVLVTKRLQIAKSSVSWSGPSLVLKSESTIETDIHFDADIILEEAIIGTVLVCDQPSISVTTSRNILVKNISLQPHEIQYPIRSGSHVKGTEDYVSAYVSHKASCVKALKFKSK